MAKQEGWPLDELTLLEEGGAVHALDAHSNTLYLVHISNAERLESLNMPNIYKTKTFQAKQYCFYMFDIKCSLSTFL